MPESFFFVSNFVTIHKGLTGDLKNTDISFTVVICGWAQIYSRVKEGWVSVDFLVIVILNEQVQEDNELKRG